MNKQLTNIAPQPVGENGHIRVSDFVSNPGDCFGSPKTVEDLYHRALEYARRMLREMPDEIEVVTQPSGDRWLEKLYKHGKCIGTEHVPHENFPGTGIGYIWLYRGKRKLVPESLEEFEKSLPDFWKARLRLYP